MAQKEAVNTFTGGMIMDTHPLTTPNNVLTNCLNGTLVTFNGNEMILQNDMGNAIIKSNKNGDLVKLPDGFVPVGTTELGGIIYVSSFNPETKQCQIGCFPSPERNIEPDITKDPALFNVTLLINQNGTAILGVYPLIKGAIRLDLTTEELHAGDYYTINLGLGDSISSNIQYEFKLIAVSDDGDIMNLNFSEFGLKYYYTAPNPGKLALLISPKKLTSFSCTYTDLKQTGQYLTTSDVAEYIEVDNTSEYKGEHVIVYSYKYYSLNGNDFVESVYNSQLTYDNVDPSLYNQNSLIKCNNKEYLFDTESGIFKTGDFTNVSSTDNKTLVNLSNSQFKVKQTGTKYKWVAGNWNATLVCKWNDLDKEENKSVLLSEIIIDQSYPITNEDKNSKIILVENQVPVNDIIKLKVYPTINLDSQYKGYIEELVQTVILDTTLSAGLIKLTMWKYYYDNDVINLQYGFAGLLDGDKEINKITISALEYKLYSQNDSNHKELKLIELTDRDSYFGSYYTQLEIGKNLLQNKLYAVTIKIETNYCDPIYEYRWLYTNNVFNNKFNTPILDYDEEKLVLSDLKCNIKIGGDNDSAKEMPDLDAQYLSIEADTNDTINGGDYTSYGYTKNSIDDNIPFDFTYDTGNELFTLDENGSLSSQITEIKTDGITTPYNYTDKEDLVLNSYPGLKQESGISAPIWSSAYRYQYYTDYIEIEDWTNDDIHFRGRIYNKIRGKVTTVPIEGKSIYAPLVYDINTARKYNLEYKNNTILPIYYLCIECYPPLSVRKHGTMFTSECHDWIKGRLSEFRVKLTKQTNNIRLRYENSFEDINSNLSSMIETSDSFSNGTSISLNNSNTWNQGTALHKKVINNLVDFGITNSSIIPIIFTKLDGTLRNVQWSRSGNDNWKNSSGDTLQDIRLYLGSSSEGKLSRSRNGNDKGTMEFDNSSYHATIGLLDDSNNLYLSVPNYIKLLDSNYDTLSKKIFNLLTQVYVSVGRNDDYSKYCLSEYDYQQDYNAKLNISGKIKTKIISHLVVSKYTDNYFDSQTDNYEKWNHNNLMIEETDGNMYDFNCYKLFKVLQLLVQQYEDQTYSKVKTRLEGRDEGTVISCFKDQSIDAPSENANYYVINSSYKLIPAENPFKIYYNVGEISQNPDGTFTGVYTSNLFNYNFLSFDLSNSLLKYNSNGNTSSGIKINNEVGDPGEGRNREGHSATITNTIDKGL